MSATGASEEHGEFRPPATDPWKGFRGVCAGTLVLEAIVVLLAMPVVSTLGGGITWASGTFLIVLTILMIVGAGLQRRSWALKYDLALQVALIVGWVFHPGVAAVGVLFGAVFAYLLYLRRNLTERMRRGLLPGQRD